MTREPKIEFSPVHRATPERVLALWRAYQRTNLALAGGNTELVDAEINEVATEVLVGLWTGRARTWDRLAGPTDGQMSREEAIELINHMVAGRISPLHALMAAHGSATWNDSSERRWKLQVHSADGESTITVEQDQWEVAVTSALITTEGIWTRAKGVPDGVLRQLWINWMYTRKEDG
jgi:hypothetical protein